MLYESQEEQEVHLKHVVPFPAVLKSGVGLSDLPRPGCVIVSLCSLRGTGHLHDGGAEEVLQRHEEAGLQEAPEAHPQTPG